MSKEKVRPVIYQGKNIPINELSPDDFEKFIYGLSKILFKKKNIEIVGKPAGTGDGGFDIDAKNDDGDIVCIQCKRYPETDLDLAKVSNELAKVALRNYIEGNNVVEHYIISSGKVKAEVDSARKESSKKTLIDCAITEVRNKDKFKHDKKKIRKKEQDINFDKVVREYIINLKTLYVWNKVQLDSEIGTVYTQINDLLERYFNIEIVLREHPRPDFDENDYLNKYEEGKKYIDLHYKYEKIPENFISCLATIRFPVQRQLKFPLLWSVNYSFQTPPFSSN